jgi:hypothetical protein
MAGGAPEGLALPELTKFPSVTVDSVLCFL